MLDSKREVRRNQDRLVDWLLLLLWLFVVVVVTSRLMKVFWFLDGGGGDCWLVSSVHLGESGLVGGELTMMSQLVN